MQIPAGTTFAHLTVIREVAPSGLNRRFLCRCTCGNETVKFLNNLRLGRSKSCGCTYEKGATARAVMAARRRELAQETDEGRLCHTCQTWKTWDHFSADPRRTRGKTSNCMDCARWRTIRSLWGLTQYEWEWLLGAQNHRCALCEQNDSIRLNVDHDHSCCGQDRACKKCIRGMLCRVCNRMLGHVEARPSLRYRFADYLDNRPFITGLVYAGNTLAKTSAAP